MSDNKKKILEMLAGNKLSVDEAYRLLNAVDPDVAEAGNTAGRPDVKVKPKYLRVTVLPPADNDNPGKANRVNIRVPMSLIRAGMKLKSLIPAEAMDKVNGALKDKGMDIDVRSLKPEDLETMLEALGELEVDVDTSNGEKVKVFVE